MNFLWCLTIKAYRLVRKRNLFLYVKIKESEVVRSLL